MKQYKLYIFDFDGTLFDTLDSMKEVYRLTLTKYGVIYHEELARTYMLHSLPDLMKYLGISLKYKDEFIKTFHDYLDADSVFAKIKPYEDTFKVIDYMNSHNINYGMMTGNSYKHVSKTFKMFNLDISKVFPFVGNEKYKEPKPNPEGMNIAILEAKMLNNKEDILYVGDAPDDLTAATKAGIDCVLVDRSKTNKNAISSLLELFIE